MSDNVTTLVYRGKLQYAKVLGEPALNWNKDGHEWKFDFIPLDNAAAKKELTSLGVGDRLRNLSNKEGVPRYDGQEYMSFKQNAQRRDGSPNKPIEVVDINGTPWPEDKLLGNDTIADVKFVVIDNGKNRFHGVYPRSIRILDHVPYQAQTFAPLDEDDPFYKKAQETQKELRMLGMPNADQKETPPFEFDELDDEIPID